MENLKKEVILLLDNLENDKISNKELYVAKFVVIETVLKLKSLGSFYVVRDQLKQLARYNSKKKNIVSKINNLRKFLKEK